jgi:hypothetical protein
LKDLLRRALGVDPQSGVTPLPRLTWVGSQTHGYCVPEGLLGPASTCYAVGAGEDITFDTELARRFGCRVRVVDPTPEGRDHFRLVQARVEAGEPLWSANGEPFRYRCWSWSRSASGTARRRCGSGSRRATTIPRTR